MPPPATPDNPYADTDQAVTFGYAGPDLAFWGGAFGRQDNVVDRSTSAWNETCTVSAGSGNDFVFTGAGNDSLYGENGNDALHSGDGSDALVGGDGNDILNGGSSDDKLAGGSGDDTLIGGAGNDQMWGGAGHDTFALDFGSDRIHPAGHGRPAHTIHYDTVDTIHDFDMRNDVIDLAVAGNKGNYAEAQMTSGNGTDAARSLADTLMHDGTQYAFVSDGHDGYLFSAQTGHSPGAAVLDGLASVRDFDWHNIA